MRKVKMGKLGFVSLLPSLRIRQPKVVTVMKMEQMMSRRSANQREVVRNRNQASERSRVRKSDQQTVQLDQIKEYSTTSKYITSSVSLSRQNKKCS